MKRHIMAERNVGKRSGNLTLLSGTIFVGNSKWYNITRFTQTEMARGSIVCILSELCIWVNITMQTQSYRNKADSTDKVKVKKQNQRNTYTGWFSNYFAI